MAAEKGGTVLQSLWQKKKKSGGKIFISYRRQGASGHAGRLCDRLVQYCARDRVFMDISGIEAGTDFVGTIEKALEVCDVFLVIIGRNWLSCTDAQGRRRLDDPDDFIRLEVSTALGREGVRVIPVPVQGADEPSSADLPEDLKPLARRQSFPLRDERWDSDCDDLIEVLEKIVGAPEQKAGENREKGKRVSAKAISALVLILIVFGVYAGGELYDAEGYVGGVFILLVALGLSVSAFFDIRAGRTRGRILAIINLTFAGLLAVGLLGEMTDLPGGGVDYTDSPPAAVAPSATRPAVPAEPRPSASGESRESVARAPSIAGAWRGSDGMVYLVRQQGDYVRIEGQDSYQMPVISAEGSIQGRTLRVDFLSYPDLSRGEARFRISDDGRQMRGEFRNHVTGVSGTLVLTR